MPAISVKQSLPFFWLNMNLSNNYSCFMKKDALFEIIFSILGFNL